ncbi:DUF342 domain-containing protein [Butyrivibrio sp. YAB3001]|uniref:DUF342 domain-containing protein n=1 Tax=Butyrivibrio sp. YAB3001 TaxID=1520812 RepID=UPI0008F620E1|nr:FapA family protein [Butyrivibrio sp. YAB3001]SFB70395.1 Uncharacterized conserved protein, DUF342 family [Butyrivibrio sp. YAB3001]
MATQELDLINELNVYSGLDSFNSNITEKELKRCAELGLDANMLRNLGFNSLQLAEIRKGLEDPNVDVKRYINPKMSWTDMEELRLEMSQGIDMTMYRAQGFDNQQLYQIRTGLAEGVDVSVYAKKEYLADQMRELRHGLNRRNGVPVIFFQDPQFDSLQMREIRKGLQAGLDVSGYADVNMSYLKMRAIRESAEDGLFFDETSIGKYTASILDQMHKAYVDQVDISGYVRKRYDAEQLEEIRLALKENIPIHDYITIDMRGDAIKEVRLGLEEGIDVKKYADAAYGWQQMREMRQGLENQIDITPYCKPLYRADQMREIRLGLEGGLDISKYSSMMYTAKDMRRIREKLVMGDIQTMISDDGLEGSVLDRTGGVSDNAVLLSSMLLNRNDYVEISPDKMMCWVKLPKRTDGINYTEDAVVAFLIKIGVKKGIDRTLIKKMLANPEPGLKYLVAAGKEVVNGSDGYYEYSFDPENKTEISFDSEGEIDFSKLDMVQQVHVGDKIAIYHRANKGSDGFNVYGEVIKAAHGKEIPILKGDGFMIMNDRVTYVAKYTGAITLKDNIINIKKVMVVPEVKITDKKINYDGVVFVQENVRSGSEIVATGDVIIGGYMESSYITSGGNVVIAGGANCPVRGSINAKGNVTAKFCEGVTITGNEISANYFINCKINAKGMVKTFGRQGMIYGGNIQSVEGVESAILGNKSGGRTIINLGASAAILKEYGDLQKQISREQEDLKTLTVEKNRLQEIGVVDKKLMQWKIKINAAVGVKESKIKELNKKKEGLDEEIKKGSNARVVVTSIIYAGTFIVIDGVAYKVQEDRKTVNKITYRTDAKKEKVITL